LPNLLAIGVTVGGLLLDVIAPRPKPRAGLPPVPISGRRLEDTASSIPSQAIVQSW
jgi:hypothetical protein